MQILPGRITFPQITRIEGWSSNPGIVTLIAASIEITTIDLGWVEVGDRVCMTGYMYGTKGAIAGDTEFRISYIGGGAVMHQLVNLLSSYFRLPGVPPFKVVRITFSSIGRIITAGALIVRTTGISFGSNTVIAPNQGQMYARVIPGV